MTFSIVARDPSTGALGVATATAGPAVGALVPHVRPSCGAVATQAMTNPYLALDLLERIDALGAADALEAACAADPGREQRQLIAVDRNGQAAGWTGSACEAFAGHLLGPGVAVAGNILAGPPVLEAMLGGYASSGTLAERLLAAMTAGQQAGGDRRGTGSSALKVFGPEAYPLVDLRVDWSETPVADLAHLLQRTTSGSYAAFFATVPRRGR